MGLLLPRLTMKSRPERFPRRPVLSFRAKLSLRLPTRIAFAGNSTQSEEFMREPSPAQVAKSG
jgi:hypothetical protein